MELETKQKLAFNGALVSAAFAAGAASVAALGPISRFDGLSMPRAIEGQHVKADPQEAAAMERMKEVAVPLSFGAALLAVALSFYALASRGISRSQAAQ